MLISVLLSFCRVLLRVFFQLIHHNWPSSHTINTESRQSPENDDSTLFHTFFVTVLFFFSVFFCFYHFSWLAYNREFDSRDRTVRCMEQLFFIASLFLSWDRLFTEDLAEHWRVFSRHKPENCIGSMGQEFRLR